MSTEPATSVTTDRPPVADPTVPGASAGPRRRLSWRLVAGAVAAMAVLAVASCAAGSNDSASSGDAGGSTAEAAMPADEPADGLDFSAASEADANSAGGSARDLAATSDVKQANAPTAVTQRAVISTGNVALHADDVAELRFDVRQVVDEHQGQITDEQTESDSDGLVSRSRLVVRVPAKEFDDTMNALEDVGDVDSSKRTSEDVTIQVIDTDVRVRAQEASLRRIEALLARAQNLRDIVAIESQLTRRQADLDSLKQQQAWLADQTSMSTITVQLRHTPKAAAKPKAEEHGFLAGLAAGWDGLKSATTGTLTVVGALLPFAIVLLVLGLPLWAVGRRLQRRRQPGGAVDGEPAI
ncbi:DUF4349 domain-containing protein [Nocardioides sp.]|uniref:DUF4349 domain-containing protein n=1 Tax=Nocardioides sp. TaxID=35761 RepID=UPI003526CCE9